MQQYTNPELNILRFSVEDVICASGQGSGGSVANGADKDNAYIAAGDLFGGEMDFY